MFSLKLDEENITICVLNCLWLRATPCPNLDLSGRMKINCLVLQKYTLSLKLYEGKITVCDLNFPWLRAMILFKFNKRETE